MSAEQWVLIQKQTPDIANVTNVLLNIKYVCDEISDSKLTERQAAWWNCLAVKTFV